MSRDTLLSLFDSAVTAVSGAEATRRGLQSYTADAVYLVAVGKAAGAMTSGAMESLGDRLVRGLVISKYDHIDAKLNSIDALTCIESAHPVPDDNSLLAGESLMRFLRDVPATANVLVLFSGGASALIESLLPSMTLKDLQRVNDYLLSTGLDINQMNVVRRSVSMIKGGRLANCLQQQAVTQLLISDVPGDALTSIGSGPLVPAPAVQSVELPDLPDWLVEMMSRAAPAPSADDPLWSRVDTCIVASNQVARESAAAAARKMGFDVVLADGELTGDVPAMALKIAGVLSATGAKAGIYIWGGETTVLLPETPGRGGRNQQLALSLAMAMPEDLKWSALCCGTDGSDGPTPDAGGLVDSETLKRGIAAGLDAAAYSVAADAGNYLEQVGALVTTGPSGTNVMDVVIAVLGEP